MLQFVEVHANDEGLGSMGSDSQRVVRSQAMKWARSRQKAELKQGGATKKASAQASAKDGASAWREHRAHKKRTRKESCAPSLASNSASQVEDEGSDATTGDGTALETPSETMIETPIETPTVIPIEISDETQLVRSAASGHTSLARAGPSSPTRYAQVRCPAVWRTGFVNAFLDGYFPIYARTSAHVAKQLSYWLAPQSLSAQAGCDAVALLQHAYATGDTRVLLEGRKRHLASIECLRIEIESPAKDIQGILGILGAAQELLVCEMYTVVSTSPDAWMRHVPGIMAVIEKHSEDEVASVVHPFLLRSLRTCGFMHAIVTRKPFAIGERFSRSPKGDTPSGSTDALLQLGWRVPGLLEKADSVKFSRRTNHSSIARVRAQLLALEEDLTDWLSEYYLMQYGSETHRLDLSPPDTREGSYMSEDSFDVHSKALRFHSFLDAEYHALYWTCLLLLRQSRWDLTSRRTAADASQPDLVAEIDEIADLLCESVPYLSATAEGLVCRAMAVRAPLHFAGQWFERTRIANEEKLSWCRDVEQRIRKEVPFLQWDAVLPWSFKAMLWLAE
ncbi:hypothetical protein LTR85_011443 [Meristemomyces frigidus]|nr:hypothetical protein LTR85_011443 [Meristemomyces frigidus]